MTQEKLTHILSCLLKGRKVHADDIREVCLMAGATITRRAKDAKRAQRWRKGLTKGKV